MIICIKREIANTTWGTGGRVSIPICITPKMPKVGNLLRSFEEITVPGDIAFYQTGKPTDICILHVN